MSAIILRNSARMLKFSTAPAQCAPCSDNTTLRIKPLNAVVLEIADEEVIVFVDEDRNRIVELACLRTETAKLPQKVAEVIEHLDATVAPIYDVDVVLRVQCNPSGAAKFPGFLSAFAKRANDLALRVEHLDAVVAGIGNVEIACCIDRYSIHPGEFPLSCAASSYRFSQRVPAVKHIDCVRQIISDIDPIIRANGDPERATEISLRRVPYHPFELDGRCVVTGRVAMKHIGVRSRAKEPHVYEAG